MTELDGLLDALVADPLTEERWQVLADWLEEYDDPRRAELLRLHRRLIATCLEPDHPERPAWQQRVVALLAAGVEPCVPRRTLKVAAAVAMTFAFIPPGTFLMGSPPDEPERSDDETQHRVTLTQGYWLGIHQVTQAQWQAVMGNNPSHFRPKEGKSPGLLGRLFGSQEVPGDDPRAFEQHPVECVSWDDCQAFCQKLGEKTGKRFRLPSEAEWEYACRAGTTTPFHFGETISTDQANYDGYDTYSRGKKGESRQKTTPVGAFPANARGLHDLHGNVWEWCQDGYGEYLLEDIRDPKSTSSGAARVLRGGSWDYRPWNCRAAVRGRNVPGRRDGSIGCRVLLCLD